VRVIEFNELQVTNEYLVDELTIARQKNEILIENNRRMERLLIKTIQDLQECRCLLDEMKFQVGELATTALNRLKQS
jgi:hypothetical protein